MKAIIMQAANRVGTRVGKTANRVGTRVGVTANRVGASVGRWATNGSGGVLASTFLQAFDWAYGRALDGLPGFDGARELAEKFAARHTTPDAAIKALILSQTALAGSAGLLTGIGGFVSLPVAIPANLASALYIQVRMVAAIAHLRGHDVRTPEVRGLVLACLTGSKAADTLKNAGARLGVRVTRDVVGWMSPALVKKAEHMAGVSAPVLLKKAERVAGASATALAGAGSAVKMSKVVPVVGGVVAAGFDAAMTQLIGRAADRLFRPKPDDESPPAPQIRPPEPLPDALQPRPSRLV
ncbi:MAG: EcsC family protein [Alphaproteobacteria bacterium]